MKIGVPKEILQGEQRVALVPKEVKKLVDLKPPTTLMSSSRSASRRLAKST
jgi:NAD/NADP transhydrogenase alpha subunit